MDTSQGHVVEDVVVVLLLAVEVNAFDVGDVVVRLRRTGHLHLLVVQKAVFVRLVVQQIWRQLLRMRLPWVEVILIRTRRHTRTRISQRVHTTQHHIAISNSNATVRIVGVRLQTPKLVLVGRVHNGSRRIP